VGEQGEVNIITVWDRNWKEQNKKEPTFCEYKSTKLPQCHARDRLVAILKYWHRNLTRHESRKVQLPRSESPPLIASISEAVLVCFKKILLKLPLAVSLSFGEGWGEAASPNWRECRNALCVCLPVPLKPISNSSKTFTITTIPPSTPIISTNTNCISKVA
jgi:hypothetical protein